jgi:DNA-binding IclR family transcriptional regulator
MSKIVNRTLEFFETFAQQKRPLSLTDLVRLLDIPLSSCHDVVQALEDRGYLYEVRPRAGYYPTARLFDLARAIVEHDPVAQRAEPVLEQLAKTLNASVSLAKGKGTQLTYLVVSTPPDPLRFMVTPGSAVRNFYATSAGKAFLASFPPEERKAMVAQMELAPLTKATITSKKALLKDLEQSEARGWFMNREESVEDALTIARRFTWNGSIYVLTAASTLKRMELQLKAAVKALIAAADELRASE